MSRGTLFAGPTAIRRDRRAACKDRAQSVVIRAEGIGSYLWLWQRAQQPTVIPMTDEVRTSTSSGHHHIHSARREGPGRFVGISSDSGVLRRKAGGAARRSIVISASHFFSILLPVVGHFITAICLIRKLVVWLVSIERPNGRSRGKRHAKGRTAVILSEAFGIGVTGEVQPVGGPQRSP